jgi:hypothetical protein
MKIQNKFHKRIAELMALRQVYHQRLTSVNSYIEQSVLDSLNSMIKYVNQRKGQIRVYQKQIEKETISFCTEMYNAMQFTMMLLFSRPAVAEYARPCDMGALCI